MWTALIYALAITLIGAFLFTAVEWYEPNPRLATVFKIATASNARGLSGIGCGLRRGSWPECQADHDGLLCGPLC